MESQHGKNSATTVKNSGTQNLETRYITFLVSTMQKITPG